MVNFSQDLNKLFNKTENIFYLKAISMEEIAFMLKWY